MKYLKIASRDDVESIPEESWSLVCERSSTAKVRRQGCIRTLITQIGNFVRRQGCIRTLSKQVGSFISTGAMIAQVRDFKSVNGVYWITLILPDGGEHHAPLGLYFDIFLVPQNAVSK